MNGAAIDAILIVAKAMGLSTDEARAELARLQAVERERDAWRRAAQSLTPGGSEFTEPHECERYAKRRTQDQHELILKFKAERDELAAALQKKGE
jgi:hypothetical protein